MLGDVAEVREAPAVRRGIAHRLQGEVVSCRIVKQFGADTVEVAAGIRAALIEVCRRACRRACTSGWSTTSRCWSRRRSAASGRAVLLGGVGVALVLVLLLGNLRAALLVTLTIPVSIAMAGMLLQRFGVGLNTMTLGGLAIAVGLLVDASIIVTENILHRVQGVAVGRARRGVAPGAAVEVGRPIAFATLIVVAVFVPLFAMTGIEGRMYQPLAAAVVATLTASLALALTTVPAVASRLLHSPRADGGDRVLIRAVKRLYGPALDACLARPMAVRIVALLIAIPTIGMGLKIGSDFIPPLNEGAFLLQTLRAGGSVPRTSGPTQSPGGGPAPGLSGGGRRAGRWRVFT